MISKKNLQIPFIYIRIPKTGSRSVAYSLKEWKNPDYEINFLLKGDGKESRHLTIEEISQFLNEYNDNIDDYWKFTVVRNPYNRLISQCKGQNAIDRFDDWISKKYAKRKIKYPKFEGQQPIFKTQTSYLKINKQWKIDKIYKYTDGMTNIIEDLSGKLNLKLKEYTIGRNQECSDWRFYTEIFTPKSLKLINDFFKEDFDNFGYQRI